MSIYDFDKTNEREKENASTFYTFTCNFCAYLHDGALHHTTALYINITQSKNNFNARLFRFFLEGLNST